MWPYKGGGPSSLILSYILHGHIPHYGGGHRDALLDAKLRNLPDLLHVTPDTWSHFPSDIRYATHALPINVLLDTLIRPDADTQINPVSCVEWRHEPNRAVNHLVLASANKSGGVWAQNVGSVVDSIGTLSYAEMLSLPGYTFEDYYLQTYGKPLPELDRPTRTEVAAYYAAYPATVGISDSIRQGFTARSISRHAKGFLIQPGNIFSKNLVLASGIFDHTIQPPICLSPLLSCHQPTLPLLVYGSGYSAGDAIVSCPSNRKIIHIYRWDPVNRPSPLKGCHRQAYPEYAGVYLQMKAAALDSKSRSVTSPMMRRKSNPFFKRDWDTTYEGFPNAQIEDILETSDQTIIKIRTEDGAIEERTVGDLQYVVGRRGSLNYLDSSLRDEVLPGNGNCCDSTDSNNISNKTFLEKTETSTEVARSVFIIGSLTGDSLVRHAFGGCVFAASKILGASQPGSAQTTRINSTRQQYASWAPRNGLYRNAIHI